MPFADVVTFLGKIQLDSNLVSDDISILNANQLNSSFLEEEDICIFNANLNSFS